MRKIYLAINTVTRFSLLILMIICLTIGGCSDNKTKQDKKNLIPEKELISVLTDIHITNGLLILPQINAWTSALDSISTYIQVIEKHGYTKEMMDRTMKYYFTNDPVKLNKIYDQVLGILSEMESRVEKQLALEQVKNTNLWRGKDFYYFPASSGNDSTMFDLTLNRPGIYKISFSAILFPDDESVNPRPIVYTTAVDSIETGKKQYLRAINYLKDGRQHYYELVFQVERNISHLKGWLYYPENRTNNTVKHIRIDNISITSSPFL